MPIAAARTFVIAWILAAGPAWAGDRLNIVPGEKLDSGLGELTARPVARKEPPVEGNRVPGEKLDSGLGDPNVYRDWARKQSAVRGGSVQARAER